MDAPRTKEEHKRLTAFRDLIQTTIDELGRISMPLQISHLIERHGDAWRDFDAEFLQVLEGIKGQSWGMDAAHLRQVVQALKTHLEKNLAMVDGRLRPL